MLPAMLTLRTSPTTHFLRHFGEMLIAMAGLPGERATVWVGPPLLARGPSPGLLTPTWLPLLPLASPPLPPVPIRS